ncbi:Hypothetical predicted protein [Olea europaea subsp. europaea]|uniref:Uncharacterized protein n=1 Tax=Olea europaea subsp. europaea TaxID=158383 RepID=A0A8S0SYY0_OLEEU|nr:Hypothetical predicted protein [Olea europaea subsp. europaea]
MNKEIDGWDMDDSEDQYGSVGSNEMEELVEPFPNTAASLIAPMTMKVEGGGGLKQQECSENFFSWQLLPGSMSVFSEVHQNDFLTKHQISMVLINFLHVFHVISLSLLSLSSSELPHLIMSMTNHRNMIVPFIISYFASSISCGISNLKGAKGFYY